MNQNCACRLIVDCAALFVLFLAAPAEAQLQSFPKQELVDYTAQNPFDRLPDGRPKVPDALLERARDLSSEDIWATLQQKGYNNQYADGFLVAHPGKTPVGRAFTVQFMPLRTDVDDVLQAKAKARGIERLGNQTAIDMLQPGDVLVVDLFGKKVNGTIVGDNLFTTSWLRLTEAGWLWTAASATSMASRKSRCRLISVLWILLPSETSC